MFSQAFHQFHFISSTFLRQSADTHVWNVIYTGEDGQCADGLFRNCLSYICSDWICSKYTPLFIPYPNSCAFGDERKSTCNSNSPIMKNIIHYALVWNSFNRSDFAYNKWKNS